MAVVLRQQKEKEKTIPAAHNLLNKKDKSIKIKPILFSSSGV